MKSSGLAWLGLASRLVETGEGVSAKQQDGDWHQADAISGKQFTASVSAF